MVERVHKNFYKIHEKCLCSVFVDEHLMRKVNKILLKYQNELNALLENNREHLINEQWSLAHPHQKQTSFHGTDLKPVTKKKLSHGFSTTKVVDLFNIGSASIHDKDVLMEVQKIMEKETEAPVITCFVCDRKIPDHEPRGFHTNGKRTCFPDCEAREPDSGYETIGIEDGKPKFSASQN